MIKTPTYTDRLSSYAKETNSYIYFFAMHPYRQGGFAGYLDTPHAIFKAFVNDFDETFSSSWEAQQYYGKTDAFVGFKNTKRTMSLSWKIPSSNLEEAKQAYNSLNNLAVMFYPTYISAGAIFYKKRKMYAGDSNWTAQSDPYEDEDAMALGAFNPNQLLQSEAFFGALNSDTQEQLMTIMQPSALPLGKPPLIGVSWGEFIKNRDEMGRLAGPLFGSPSMDGYGGASPEILAADFNSARKRALICHVENFSMSPEIEKGYFTGTGYSLYPKVWSCSIALNVQHTHELGRQEEPW